MKNMISQTIVNKELRLARLLHNFAFKSIIICTLIFTFNHSPLQAQEVNYTNPSWWFGAAGGANINFYRGTTQYLTTNFIAPAAFYNGMGVGVFAAPLIEYHRPKSMWGFMLQAGYDSRRGTFDQVIAPCGFPEDLNTNLDYITIEPSLRFAPFKSNFYLYAGPRFSFNLNNNFTYQMGTNSDFPDHLPYPEVNGTFSKTEPYPISMQVGAGLDIPLSSQNKQTKTVLSPFVSFQPYFGQDPRSIESWNITTLRVGIALKFGRGHKVSVPAPEMVIPFVPITAPLVNFAVISPENIPAERRVREIFPLLNYLFFDLNSTDIPDRYVLLNKGQVKNFKEEQLEQFAPIKLAGRSNRQMVAYYNILNIIGDRMGKDQYSTITLVGSSTVSTKEGRLIAESVQRYLVDVFGISASRVNIEVRATPKLPSKQPGGILELKLLAQEDCRVSVESSSPALLMEFQSGPDSFLKPVDIIAIQEAPIDSYVSFNIAKGNENLSSWTLEVKDQKGKVKIFGPYSQKEISLPGKLFLDDQIEGNYQVTMIGKAKNGTTVKRDTTVHMKLWAPPVQEEGMRFSVIYEFDDSKAIAIYEKYLTEIVAPKIPIGASVRIHGYTDIIGDEANNQRLSLARANDVKTILEKSLAKLGRNDVKLEVYGFGEDQKLSQFDNVFPEERFYNRTVIIDIFLQE